MLSSVTARWMRTEISARLAAMILEKGGAGGEAVMRVETAVGSAATWRAVVDVGPWWMGREGENAEAVRPSAERRARLAGRRMAMVSKLGFCRDAWQWSGVNESMNEKLDVDLCKENTR